MAEQFTRQRSDYDGLSIPTVTFFGRRGYRNVFTLIQRAALLKDEMKIGQADPLHIAEVGCSSGQNLWLLAAGLAVNNVAFKIQGYDINPSAIRCATRRYPETKDNLAAILDEYRLPPGIVDLFDQVTPEHIKPSAELRQHDVRFSVADMRHDQLEPAHIAIANNVLSYFRGDNEASVAQNLARALSPEGILITNSSYGTTHDALAAQNFQECVLPSVFGLSEFYQLAKGAHERAAS